MTTHYVELIDQLNNSSSDEFMAKSTEFANTYAEDPNALLATGVFEENTGIAVEKLREVDVPADTVAGDMAAAATPQATAAAPSSSYGTPRKSSGSNSTKVVHLSGRFGQSTPTPTGGQLKSITTHSTVTSRATSTGSHEANTW